MASLRRPLLPMIIIIAISVVTPTKLPACPYCTNTIHALLYSGSVGGAFSSLLNRMGGTLSEVHQALLFDQPRRAPEMVARFMRDWREFTEGFPTPPPELGARPNWNEFQQQGTEIIDRMARLVDRAEIDEAAIVLTELRDIVDGLFGISGVWVVAEDWLETSLDGPALAATARLLVPFIMEELRESPQGKRAVLARPTTLRSFSFPADSTVTTADERGVDETLRRTLDASGFRLVSRTAGKESGTWDLVVDIEDGRQIRRVARDRSEQGDVLERIESAGWADVRFLCEDENDGILGIGIRRIAYRTTLVLTRSPADESWELTQSVVEPLDPAAAIVLTPATFTMGSATR